MPISVHFSVKERPVLLYSSLCSFFFFYSLFILLHSAFLFRETIILGHLGLLSLLCAEETASHFVSLLRDNLRLSVSIRESKRRGPSPSRSKSGRNTGSLPRSFEKNCRLALDFVRACPRSALFFPVVCFSSRVRRRRKRLNYDYLLTEPCQAILFEFYSNDILSKTMHLKHGDKPALKLELNIRKSVDSSLD